MVIVNATPRKAQRNPILTALTLISLFIGIGLWWFFVVASFSTKDGGSKLRGQQQDYAVGASETDKSDNEPIVLTTSKGIMQLSAPSMLQSKRPYIMYGTAWKKDATASLVSNAVMSGFRFIDTACQPKHYNEAGVGEGWTTAVAKLGLGRSDLFLQTKFTSVDGQDPKNIPYDADDVLEEQVKQSLTKSLFNLQTDYIDSLVMHSPMRDHELTMRVWRVFESFVNDGKVRQIGIANCYDPRKFLRIYKDSIIKPKVLQNRFYSDSGFDTELRGLCDSYGVTYQSFWTLTANRDALRRREWEEMAMRKDLTPQTLMYAYMMTQGHTPLSGTQDVIHMEEDVNVMLRFQNGEQVLSEDEVETLSSLLGVP